MTDNNFTDGIINVSNEIVNNRNALNNNVISNNKLGNEQMVACYKSGVGSKIVRTKAGKVLNDTLQFSTTEDETFFNLRLAKHVKDAAKFMLAFGRGIIVLHKKGDSLSQPLGEFDPDTVKIQTFSGDMVTAQGADINLESDRYMKPRAYQVRGSTIHPSRVIDFTYVKPVELDAAQYQYGGISEFELIYDQILADAIVSRASANILEKSSSIFYKVKGFKDAMRAKEDSLIVRYFSRVEDLRSIMGATIVDEEDSVEQLTQALSNLVETDQITLRRLSMVTGIPLPILVGENVKGLNSSGDTEQQTWLETLGNLQSDYLLEPINELGGKFKMGTIEFKENQGETVATKMAYEKLVLENAKMLDELGEDFGEYLKDKGITSGDDWSEFFKNEA